MSGPAAFAMAGVKHDDVDVLMGYDSFTITALLHLEDLGFCAKGEGGAFVEDGKLGPGGSLPMNTNGGGLSYTHPGMYGMFLLVEAVRQLRGECRRPPGGRRPGGRGPRLGRRAVDDGHGRARDGGDAVTITSLFEPPPSEATGPYWEASRERRLVVPWCPACDRAFWAPREVCPSCLDPGVEWRDAAGTGVVYAASVHHKPGPGRSPDDGPTSWRSSSWPRASG